MGMGALAVGVVASSTKHAEIGGRREMVCSVPVISVPGLLLLIFTSEVVHFDGLGHGKESRVIGRWGWNRFSLSEIGVNTGSDLGADETVANGKRPAAPFHELSFQFMLGLQKIFIV